jgi:iron complex outermembrane receptor protein
VNPFIDADQRILNRYVDASRSDAKTFNVDNSAEAKFETGALKHTLLVGLDYSKFRQQQSGYGDLAEGNAIDVFDPVYNPIDFSNVTSYRNPLARQFQTGVYVQDQIKLDNWIATLGLRRDRAKNKVEGSDAQIDMQTTGRYGLTYVFDNGWAPYVSYAEAFLPVADTDRNGNLFKPQEGEQWELGVKYMPEGSKTKFTAAIFEITDTNRLTPDPVDPNFSVQKAEVRSRGLELEAATSFDNRLDVIASYSYTDARYSKSNNPDEKGNQVETIPKHLASAWAVKRFAIGDTDGFRAGLGVRYVGDSWDSTHAIKAPDVTLFDALLGFDSGSWRYALNASNLFDKEYVSTCLSRGDCWLGSRRQAIASATYTW